MSELSDMSRNSDMFCAQAVAFMESADGKSTPPDKLKARAYDCAAGKQDAATCFSIGYAYGTQVVDPQ